MNIITDNSFQQQIEPFNKSAASQVGYNIRKIRMEKGLSQAELGALVGLTADRIQKYENGVRKPRPEMLERLAHVLGVNSLALEGPLIVTLDDVMFAFFELENRFNMTIEKGPKGQPPSMCLKLVFNTDRELYDNMQEWYRVYTMTQAQLEAASSEEEKEEILKAYHMWEWSFPQPLIDKTQRQLKKLDIKHKIEKLQEAYDELDSEEDE